MDIVYTNLEMQNFLRTEDLFITIEENIYLNYIQKLI